MTGLTQLVLNSKQRALANGLYLTCGSVLLLPFL
jgi:hypothetical protein